MEVSMPRAERLERQRREGLVIAAGDLPPPRIVGVQIEELDPQDRGLELVQTRVSPLRLGVVAPAPAILAQAAEAIGESGVSGRDRAGVPVSAQVLGGVEGKRSGHPERAGLLLPQARSVALSAVLQENGAALGGQAP